LRIISANSNLYSVLAMNEGTQGYCLTKKTEGRKSRDTFPLNGPTGNKNTRGSKTIFWHKYLQCKNGYSTPFPHNIALNWQLFKDITRQCLLKGTVPVRAEYLRSVSHAELLNLARNCMRSNPNSKQLQFVT
jgi:hypothetical protein